MLRESVLAPDDHVAGLEAAWGRVENFDLGVTRRDPVGVVGTVQGWYERHPSFVFGHEHCGVGFWDVLCVDVGDLGVGWVAYWCGSVVWWDV